MNEIFKVTVTDQGHSQYPVDTELFISIGHHGICITPIVDDMPSKLSHCLGKATCQWCGGVLEDDCTNSECVAYNPSHSELPVFFGDTCHINTEFGGKGVTVTRVTYPVFKKLYDYALIQEQYTFMFEGQIVLTSYAKDVCEYMEVQL